MRTKLVIRKKNRAEEKREYQVVKSLRNWAMAPARKAERRGRLEVSKGAGANGEDDVLMEDEAASPTVITSSINAEPKTVPLWSLAGNFDDGGRIRFRLGKKVEIGDWSSISTGIVMKHRSCFRLDY